MSCGYPRARSRPLAFPFREPEGEQTGESDQLLGLVQMAHRTPNGDARRSGGLFLRPMSGSVTRRRLAATDRREYLQLARDEAEGGAGGGPVLYVQPHARRRARQPAGQADLDPAGTAMVVALGRPAQGALAEVQFARVSCQQSSAAMQASNGMSAVRRNDSQSAPAETGRYQRNRASPDPPRS